MIGINLLESMVGDVNLFLNEPDDVTLAEIEVMIAGMADLSIFVRYIRLYM